MPASTLKRRRWSPRRLPRRHTEEIAKLDEQPILSSLDRCERLIEQLALPVTQLSGAGELLLFDSGLLLGANPARTPRALAERE